MFSHVIRVLLVKVQNRQYWECYNSVFFSSDPLIGRMLRKCLMLHPEVDQKTAVSSSAQLPVMLVSLASSQPWGCTAVDFSDGSTPFTRGVGVGGFPLLPNIPSY